MKAEARLGYKLTEVGVIPQEWELVCLKDLGTRSKPSIKAGPFGSALTKAVYVPEGYKVYGQEQVIRGDHKYGDYFVTKAKFSELSACSVSPGDILLSLVGTAGKLIVLPNDAAPGIINPRLLRLSFDKSRVYPFFFKAVFETAAVQTYLQRYAQGGTMGVLNAGVLRPVVIALPSLEEQKSISKVLSDIDALISSLNQLIGKKRNIRQAVMQQLLTGRCRLPGFSGDWEVSRLGDVAAFLKGQGLSKSELRAGGTRPCIHYGELFTHYPATIQQITSRTDIDSAVFLSKANDVLMPTSDVTPRGLAKASCIKQKDVILGSDILVIRPEPKTVNGSFLSYVIRHDEEQVLRLVSGTTVFHLYGTDMKKFTFMRPPLDEQIAIVSVLSDIGAELDALEARRYQAQQLMQGMMQELLTGRIRLV